MLFRTICGNLGKGNEEESKEGQDLLSSVVANTWTGSRYCRWHRRP